jgi:AhpD family alkylhydroperoxidase
MTQAYPAGRMQLAERAPKQAMGAMLRFQTSIKLEEPLHHLLSLRASQINGCAFCIDMHWKDARAAGETEERLYSLDAWRESPIYDARERAALELCEAMTLIHEGHVSDKVWEQASDALGEELAQVVFAVAAINTWNRLMITTRAEPGHYEVGMLAAA